MDNLYHTDLRPLDCNGVPMKPLDLVVINEIPEHYWLDPDFATLRKYGGCYGLITYSNDGGIEYPPYFLGNRQHPGWVSGDGGVVNVLSHRVTDERDVATGEFWIPPTSLRKIPFNSLIMNIFVEYPWQMGEEDGPGSTFFVREGIPEYEHIKRILETPRAVLEAAHQAAMAVLGPCSKPAG
jgi:hypothetical protein